MFLVGTLGEWGIVAYAMKSGLCSLSFSYISYSEGQFS